MVRSDGKILGEALATQAEVHAPWGGVVPKLAQEAHEAAMDATVAQALHQAGIRPQDLDAVAVTVGPGLSLCLRVGVLKARQLCAAHNLPLVPVHHMEAHALVGRLFGEEEPTFASGSPPTPPALDAAVAAVMEINGAATSSIESEDGTAPSTSAAAAADAAAWAPTPPFPFLCLLVSGGHNLLLLVRGVGNYEQLGATLDDALGEAYDKVARMLGLPLAPSGGAALEALAVQGDPQAFRFTVPLKKRPNCNFSYAGLKTAARLAIEEALGPDPALGDPQVRADIAASFQRVAVRHLAERTARGAQWATETCPGLSTLVVAGGVAANKAVRSELQAVADATGLKLVCPPPQYCTDNGAMVAWAGVERYLLGLWEPVHSVGASSSGTSTQPGAAVAAAGQAGQAGQGAANEDERVWIDLRPRWPLTDIVDERSAPAQRSARKERIHASLTALTQQALEELRQQQQGPQHDQQAGQPVATSQAA